MDRRGGCLTEHASEFAATHAQIPISTPPQSPIFESIEANSHIDSKNRTAQSDSRRGSSKPNTNLPGAPVIGASDVVMSKTTDLTQSLPENSHSIAGAEVTRLQMLKK